MTTGIPSQNYALAITASGQRHNPPVAYDLSGASIDIGAAEDNQIVLTGPGVEPYHMAVRLVRRTLCVVIDLAAARQNGESFWLDRRGDDSFYCPEHGKLPELRDTGRCPLCLEETRPVWLLRLLRPGDEFPIGQSFTAMVLHQATPNPIDSDDAGQISPWPDVHWLENPPTHPTILVDDQTARIEGRDYPFSDSNLWAWNPPESPFPVFVHQRANRHFTRHAYSGYNREVGGLLLGRIYRDSHDGIIYPVISDTIAARYATEARGHLTFTQETWLDFIHQREEHYPDQLVVGWYHTHPGLGIFLSQWDLMIHRGFFRQTWQVALVIDPHQHAAGFFVWSGGDVLDPQQPHHLFRLSEGENGTLSERQVRVRIKLGEPVI